VDDFRREDVITAPLLGVLVTMADLGADGQPRTRASLRRASGKRAGRDRIEDLERRVAELEETVRGLAGDTEERPARRRRATP
jgi:hypothetical protein